MKMILFFFFISLEVFSLETDNYISWEIELEDSSSEINEYLIDEIKFGLQEANSEIKFQSCYEVTKKIASRFRSKLVHDNPVEIWLMNHLDQNHFYPETINYVEKSIYRRPFRFYIPKFGLAPNIQVNNIYFGMDKLTHFTWTARNYFIIYMNELKNQKTEFEAETTAIQYGFLDELTLHGLWASGVYSYADLEANYQGLKFYKNFCHSKKNNYLRLNQKLKWELVRFPRIEDYVNPKWDETFNPSYFLPENWKKIAPTLRSDYCSMRKDHKVMERFDHYQKFTDKSFSEIYIHSLQQQKSISTPFDISQSLEKVCLAN